MAKKERLLTKKEVAEARERRLEAQHLQIIEGNPFDEEDIAMFEMFERKRWSHERCRAYILKQARAAAAGNKSPTSKKRNPRKVIL